jgi:hypothetical protein
MSMARINVEDTLWSDPRFLKLCIALGDEMKAIGAIVLAWKLAQKYWCPDKKPIPEAAFSELPSALITSGLAEKLNDGIRMRGSEEHFSWWFERREAGRKGGQISADKRSSSAKHSSSSAQAAGSKSKQIEPSSSLSISISNSLSNSDSNNSISTVVEKSTPVPDVKFDAKSVDEIFSIIPEQKRALWLDLYGDEEFIIREIKKAFGWYSDNPKKKPKSLKSWLRVLSLWLERGWGFRAKTIPGQTSTQTNEFKNAHLLKMLKDEAG